MSCACINTYVCFDCEKKIKWKRLDRMERLILLDYAEKLKNNTAQIKDLMEVEANSLCVTMIPKNNYL